MILVNYRQKGVYRSNYQYSMDFSCVVVAHTIENQIYILHTNGMKELPCKMLTLNS